MPTTMKKPKPLIHRNSQAGFRCANCGRAMTKFSTFSSEIMNNHRMNPVTALVKANADVDAQIEAFRNSEQFCTRCKGA